MPWRELCFGRWTNALLVIPAFAGMTVFRALWINQMVHSSSRATFPCRSRFSGYRSPERRS
jgi:hypothetical protein